MEDNRQRLNPLEEALDFTWFCPQAAGQRFLTFSVEQADTWLQGQVNQIVRFIASLFACLIGLNTCSPAEAQVFQVDGVLTKTVYVGREPMMDRFFYAMSVSNQCWALRVTTGIPNEYVDLGCDGTNVFEVLYDPDFLSNPRTNRVATITSGAYPLDSAWPARVAWFVFASAPELAKDKWSIHPPTHNPRTDPVAHITELRVNEKLKRSGLPSQAEFVVSGASKASMGSNKILNLRLGRNRRDYIDGRIGHFQDGFVLCSYKVLSHTNWGDIEIPTGFVMERFAARETAARHLFSVVHGVVTNVSSLARESFRPVVKDDLFVTDRRLASFEQGVDYTGYQVTNDTWPSVDDPSVLAMFNKRRATASQIPFSRFLTDLATRRQTAFFAIILGILVPPLVFWRYWSQANKKQKRNQSKT